MITIEQLLESVDLDFEPRWVTKNAFDVVSIWGGDKEPTHRRPRWWGDTAECQGFGRLKLAEFDGKDWIDCIYEVPRKETVVRVREREWKGRKCVFWDKYRGIPYYGILGAVDDSKDTPYWCIDNNRWFRHCEIENTDSKIEKLEPLEGLQHNWLDKINELVDAVNELKAKFALPTLNPDLTDEDLRKLMRDPKYWRDKDSGIIQKVQNGFNKLYGDKN